MADGNYVSLAEVRSEGVTITDASDAKVYDKIVQAERFIEMNTGRWFYRRQAFTMILDGGDKYSAHGFWQEGVETIYLPVPIISITSISTDNTVGLLSDFIVMNRIGPPYDDRWNPRIISKNGIWPTHGISNVSIVGDFGFVEDLVSYTVPELIRVAARKLAIRFLGLKLMTGSTGVERDMELKQSEIVEERLPGYSYRLRESRGDYKKDHYFYTGDTEIDSTIEFYRYKRMSVAV